MTSRPSYEVPAISFKQSDKLAGSYKSEGNKFITFLKMFFLLITTLY